MITLSFRFPTGRFHSTPWDRHVNEGALEWPPSPWRLLRSLVCSWKMKSPKHEEDKVRTVLTPLLKLPLFGLPLATAGHTRHFMPKFKGGPENLTKIFDAFVCLDRQSEVIVQWPDAQLDESQRALLSDLLDNVGYLGRAESWCEAHLLKEDEEQSFIPNCYPLNGGNLKEGEELVRVLCADPSEALASEHVQSTAKGKAKNERPPYDPCWHLCIETAQLHKERWSDPPGSQWVPYVRRADCFSPSIRKASTIKKVNSPIQVVRYALDSSVLPLLQETLPIAEAARRTLMGIYGRVEWNATHRDEEYPADSKIRPKSKIFSGKDAEGKPLANHCHTFYLSTDEDGDGRLDHLTLYCLDGFERGSSELKALDKIRTIKRFEESSPLRVVLMGLGSADEYLPIQLRKSAVWESATPFIATRHPKARGQKRDPFQALNDDRFFLEINLREELDRLSSRTGNPQLKEAAIIPLVNSHGVYRISPRDWNSGGQASSTEIRPIQFKRTRTRKSHSGPLRSGAFRLVFTQPVQGPIALGLHSHFGMGLFLPCSEES